MAEGFPTDKPSALGQFAIPGQEDEPRTGLLEVDGSRVKVEFVPALTTRSFASLGTAPNHHADYVPVATGDISLPPYAVTLWDLATVRRSGVGIGPQSRSTSQSLRATWCIVGEHLPDPQTRFVGFRTHFNRLTEWISLSGLIWEISREVEGAGRKLWMQWMLSPVDDREMSLRDGTGYLKLVASETIDDTTVHGTAIHTRSFIEIELFDGWGLEQARLGFALPIEVLMTLLSGEACQQTAMECSTDGLKWSSVHGRGVNPDAVHTSDPEFLLRRSDVADDFLSRWIDVHHKHSPVPQVLAAALAGDFDTIEAESLALTTAVEALHRLLDPDARRWTVGDVEATQSALPSAGLPPHIERSLKSSVGQYLWEPSYPDRLDALIDPVVEVAPQVFGNKKRWKKSVIKLRTDLAHGKTGDDFDISATSALNRSLHWMLTLRLLLLADVPTETLSRAIARSSRFHRDSSRWRREVSRVYDE